MAAVTVQGLIFWGHAFLFEVRPLILEKLFPMIIPRIKSAEMAEIEKITSKQFYGGK